MKLDCEVSCMNEEELEKSGIDIVKSVKPNWNIEKVSIKHYTEGLTNKLIGFYYENFDDQILVRAYGVGTELFIDRQAEVETVKLLHSHGIGPALHAVFNNGFCYGYTPGIPLTPDTVKLKEIYPNIAKSMAAMHKIEIEDRTPKLFTFIRRFIKSMPPKFTDDQLERLKKKNISKTYLSNETNFMEKVIDEMMGKQVVFCHNDLIMNNIIYHKETEVVRFIDYEYASANYLYSDIGNHFCEFAGIEPVDYNLCPDAEFGRKFLTTYLSYFHNIPENEVSPSDVEAGWKKANVFMLTAHLLWGSWAIFQACSSDIDFDYLRYGIIRINEYKKRKEEILATMKQ